MVKGLSDDQLLAAISAAEEVALGTIQGEIASDRADAIDRYLGKAYGNELPGRSSVVSRDVADVVEGVLANVLKPFVGGDTVVTFDPRGPEDVEQAQQESDYVNFVVLERNNGFLVLNSAVKDALLLRNGYIKCGWTVRDDVVLETYNGLSDEEVAMLVQDKDVEVVQHTEYLDMVPQAPGEPPTASIPAGEMPALHDLKVRRKRPTEYVELMPTPPDEILVSERARTPGVQDADFVQHRTRKSLSQLRELGYKVDDDISDDDSGETIEDYARQRYGSKGDMWDDPTEDPARRMVLFKETWLRIDRDGDGIAELRRVCTVGQNLLADEEADLIPIASGTGVLMAHQHLGVSVYDLVQDLAQLKTALLRQFMDNKYLSNNIQWLVDADRVNVDDFMQSRPGGLKRVMGDPTTAALPVQTPDTGPSAIAGLEYLDSIRENRTGWTRYAQGMDSDSLINKTATGLTQVMSQSQMRLEMIARTIAETMVRDLFRIVHSLTLKHSTREEKVRLRNQWVPVNPREWVRRTDLSISVGLGSTSQQQMLQNLMLIGQAQQQAMPLGIVTPLNIYNTLKRMANAAGFKNPAEFFTEPPKTPKMGPDGQPVIGADGKPEMESQMPPPQKDPLVQAEEVKAQAGMQKAQMDGQLRMQEAQANAALEMQKEQQRLELELRKAQLQEETRYRIAMAEVGKDLMIAGNQAKMQEKEMALDVAQQQIQAERDTMGQENEHLRAKEQAVGEQAKTIPALVEALNQVVANMQVPMEVEIIRDARGKAVGARRRAPQQ